jgi:hypothetical protein
MTLAATQSQDTWTRAKQGASIESDNGAMHRVYIGQRINKNQLFVRESDIRCVGRDFCSRTAAPALTSALGSVHHHPLLSVTNILEHSRKVHPIFCHFGTCFRSPYGVHFTPYPYRIPSLTDALNTFAGMWIYRQIFWYQRRFVSTEATVIPFFRETNFINRLVDQHYIHRKEPPLSQI